MKNGFTIIELVISIFILSIAVVGIFSAFSVMVILTADASDRLTGTYLSQEGMEIIRNIRDTNWLNMDTCIGETCGYNWVDGLTVDGINNSIDCTQGCEADYTTTGAGANPVLPYTTGRYLSINTNGFYNYTDGTDTKFKRKITITPVEDVGGPSDHIINVKAQVSWNGKANILNASGFSADNCIVGSNCIIAEETLYDWYNYVAPTL